MSLSEGNNNFIDRDGILFKVRLDFKSNGKPGRLLFGGKTSEKTAEELREQQMAIFRNVPIQGIQIMDIDISTDIYTMYDELENTDAAYAPMVLTVKADNLECIVRFITREDFRKIDILDPASITLSHYELERLLFKVHEEMREYRFRLEKKFNIK
ncbi:MAG: hypothetical protein ACOX0T_11745 [Pelotomaculum sp.]|jgi:hypothetical protein